jgi:hypothetical protein
VQSLFYLRPGALNIEKQAVGIGQAFGFEFESGRNIDGNASQIPQRPEPDGAYFV